MKRLVFLLSIAAAVGACKKDSAADPTPTRTDLLTAKTWQISTISFSSSGISLPAGQFATACRLDNNLKFSTDKTLVVDEGATKCNTSDPQMQSGTWAFASNEQTKVTLTVPGGILSGDFDIKELSANTLRLNGNPPILPGLPVTVDVTLSPK